jgi:hypothetical protein
MSGIPVLADLRHAFSTVLMIVAVLGSFRSFFRPQRMLDGVKVLERTKVGQYECLHRAFPFWKRGDACFVHYSARRGYKHGMACPRSARMGAGG